MSITKKQNILAIYGIQDKNPDFPEISHDHSIAFFTKGKLTKYIQQERISRKKHDNTLHVDLLELLKIEMLSLPDATTTIVFVDNILGRSFISVNGNVRFEAPLPQNLSLGLEKGKCLWLDHEMEAYVLNHELAHVYTCLPYFGPFKENSLLLHFDGGASKSNCSAWRYKNKQIRLVEANWKLKGLSDLFNSNALVFWILGGNPKNQQGIPGKMMGYASWGCYSKKIEDWLTKHQMFSDIWRNKAKFLKEASDFLGKPFKAIDKKDPFVQDIVATMHYVFQRNFLLYLKHLQQKTHCEHLYYSGGSALNIKVNRAIVDSGIFKNVFIPPCCNDSGLAIGAGAFLNSALGLKTELISPYGNNWGLNGEMTNSYKHGELYKIAELLSKGSVVGVCNNAGETGPRALGNRSILALADSKIISKKVSEAIKKREWYRPVAPIMLAKNLSFFTEDIHIPHLSKYMLLEYMVKPYAKDNMAGAVHVDGTARIQTIEERSDNPFMYDLLVVMESKYNVKSLINTSFNSSGDPMVHTKEDALSAAKKMKLEAVVVNGILTVC